MIVRRLTGSTATQRSAQNATLPSRKMEVVITWCVRHVKQSSAGNAKVLGNHTDQAGEWLCGYYIITGSSTIHSLSLSYSLSHSLSFSLSLSLSLSLAPSPQVQVQSIQ